ncbi:S8 family serine peptidase [Pararoseomonas sp. SCSIO 73927]|uniref:S8 family serine peptidase n=1 Tax=Pararoseomonas sp. SCSIO 73927 TaxID=3114537 RepID=UPI0030D24B57
MREQHGMARPGRGLGWFRPVALALALAILAPAPDRSGFGFGPMGAAALADDDDDDRRPRRAAPRRAPARQAPARPAPELVVSVPAGAELDRLSGRGFEVVARADFPLLGGVVARLRGRGGETPAAARGRLRDLLPGAVLDDNHLYRQNAFACGAAGCDAFRMVRWQPSAGTCPAAPRIGLIDSGVSADHAALKGSAVEQLSVLGPDRRPASPTHGTAVAALLVGRPESGTPGLLPGARLVVAGSFHRGPAGDDTADAFDLARALDALAGRDVPVINMSFSGPANALLERAVAAVRARDIALVAAAGNAGPRAAPLYPAAYPGVVAVTAVDHEGQVYPRASAGPHIALAAPGVRLWTAAPGEGAGTLRSGTSFAAPFVAASLAALRAAAPERRIGDLVARLTGGAEDRGAPGRDPVYGWGILRALDCSAL